MVRWIAVFVAALLQALLPGAVSSRVPAAPADELGAVGPAIVCADERAASAFRDYLRFLERHRERLRAEIATLALLGASDVTYLVRISRELAGEAQGSLSTDGSRILITVTDSGTERVSLNARLAHELEHARQFEAGELAFRRASNSDRWVPSEGTYDIGDEVKAWDAQLRAASAGELWTTSRGVPRPTALGRFKMAGSREERACVLFELGYDDLPCAFGRNFVYPDACQSAPGTLVVCGGNIFGRVHGAGQRPPL